MLGGSWSVAAGYRPVLGIGIRTQWSYDFGIGLYTTAFTGGFMAYRVFPKYRHAFAAILAGVDWDGSFAPGFGLGIRF